MTRIIGRPPRPWHTRPHEPFRADSHGADRCRRAGARAAPPDAPRPRALGPPRSRTAPAGHPRAAAPVPLSPAGGAGLQARDGGAGATGIPHHDLARGTSVTLPLRYVLTAAGAFLLPAPPPPPPPPPRP